MTKALSSNSYRGSHKAQNSTAKPITKPPKRRSTYGGITLEYILVTTFSIIATMTALTFMKKVVASKISAISEELSIDEEGSNGFFD